MAIKDVFKTVENAKQDIENLSIENLKSELASNEDVLLLDIREVQEAVDLGTIPGAIHAARGMLEFWASPSSPYYRDYFQEHRRTIVFCAGGGRSVLAVLALKDMGFTNVAHVEEGFRGWQESGRNVEDVGATSRWVRREK